MAVTTNPDTLKLLETISKMDDAYLEMSEEFEWEMTSRDFREQSSNLFLTAYDKEVAKLGKALDEFLRQDWLDNLTPEQKEAVNWATKKFEITGDSSYEIIAEDPHWATMIYENNWESHAKPFFEGFNELPLTYFELAVENLSNDLEEFILDNTPIHQNVVPESWDSLTSGSESEDEFLTPIGSEYDLESTTPVNNLTHEGYAHTLTNNHEIPSPRSKTKSFTPPREGPQSQGKHHFLCISVL